MSVAYHDPDFVLAEGTHQVVVTLRIGSYDSKITNTIHDLHRIEIE